jgi:hypothetical protein
MRAHREDIFDFRVESTYRIMRSLEDYCLSGSWRDIMPGLIKYIRAKAFSEGLLDEEEPDRVEELRAIERDAISHFTREYLERWCMYNELFGE